MDSQSDQRGRGRGRGGRGRGRGRGRARGAYNNNYSNNDDDFNHHDINNHDSTYNGDQQNDNGYFQQQQRENSRVQSTRDGPRMNENRKRQADEDTTLSADSNQTGAIQGMDTTGLVPFGNLHFDQNTMRAVQEVFKYTHMTPVQSMTLPTILQGKDVLAKARTGTGKTLAFLIPSIDLMVKHPRRSRTDIQTVIISPTRELATQIFDEASKLTRFHPQLRSMVMVGGIPMGKDLRALKQGGASPDILVATPGRLQDHLSNTPHFADSMRGIKMLILDEGDQLLDMGFRREIERIVSHLPPNTGAHPRQSLCFSATVPPVLAKVLSTALRKEYVSIDCTTVAGGKSNDTHDTTKVPQAQGLVDFNDVFVATCMAIGDEIERNPTDHKIIVFLPTARQAGFIASMLENWFNGRSNPLGRNRTSVYEIHSRKSMPQRQKVSAAFRTAQHGVMVSSDVSARGVDYPDVSFVLQVGTPVSQEQYVHRLGRTGRAGKTGRGLILLGTFEKVFLNKLKAFKVEDGLPSLLAFLSKHGDITDVLDAIRAIDRKLKEQTYQAWLGYYKGYCKPFNWTSADLVQHANQLAIEGMGLDSVPALQKSTIGKMGLKGVPGINIDPVSNQGGGHGGSRGGRGGHGGGRR